MDELKRQTQQKITEYNKNIQYAKSKLDTQKEHIDKLKQIVSKNNTDKTEHQSRIESLEIVNEQIRQQLDDVKLSQRQNFEILQKQNKDMREQYERLQIKY